MIARFRRSRQNIGFKNFHDAREGAGRGVAAVPCDNGLVVEHRPAARGKDQDSAVAFKDHMIRGHCNRRLFRAPHSCVRATDSDVAKLQIMSDCLPGGAFASIQYSIFTGISAYIYLKNNVISMIGRFS